MRFRPRLEGLEAREVPAVNYWLGMYSTDATNPLNWSQARQPISSDELKFGFSWPPTNPACINLQGTFSSLEMDSYHPTTVTLSGPLTVGGLIIRAGALNQPSSNTDITVTFALSWSGGTLNSTSNHATVTVRGNTGLATAGISPNGGTLTTGSTLIFDVNAQGVGAQGTINPGTVQFNNGAGALVGSTVTAAIQRASVYTNGIVDFLGTGTIRIKPGGLWQVIGPGIFTSPLPIGNIGGVLQVDTGATANVTGQFQAAATSVEQTSGTIYIQGGATLKAAHGVVLTGGKLATFANTAGGSQTATIAGDVNNSGADVVICDLSSPHVFGTLYVTGNVRWTGGTYRPVLNAAAPGTADLWKVKGNFEVGGTARIAPGTINGAPQQNQLWDIMEAEVGSISLLPGANDPPIDSPAVPYTLVREGSPDK